MSTEANKALIRRFHEEVWGPGNLDVADEDFTSEYVRHDVRGTKSDPRPEGQKEIAAAFRLALPDLSFRVDFLLGEGDLLAGRRTATGTHLGPWAGVAATGRGMPFSGVKVFRFAHGKVVEIWNHRDDLGLMEHLGAPVYAGAAPE